MTSYDPEALCDHRGHWSSCPDILALDSRTWFGSRCHTLAFEEKCLFGPFFPQPLLFLCFCDMTCCFHPLVFWCIKKNQVTKQFVSESKCYKYKLIICIPLLWITHQFYCHVYDWFAIMGYVLEQQLCMVFSPGCSLSQAWNPWVTWERGDFIDSILSLLLFFFFNPSLAIGSVVSDAIIIPSI